MNNFQLLTRCLLAAAGAIDKGKGYLAYVAYEEKDHKLVEKVWSGHKFNQSPLIASDLKKGTPASYGLEADKHLVFYVNESNILKCKEFDAEEDDWNPVSLGEEENLSVHPESRLSSCFTSDGLWVFFHDSTGDFRCLVKRNELCGKPEQVPAQPPMNTPHSASVYDEKLHLFYMSEDNALHYQSKEHDNGAWEDPVMVTAKLNDVVLNFMVARDDRGFEAYFLTGSTLLLVGPSKKIVMLGDIEGNKFIPADDAEDVITLVIFASWAVVEGGKVVAEKVKKAARNGKELAEELITKGKGIIQERKGSREM
ncbi:hypothetical protein B0O99DRAFT_641527 [Bisporella sp. PMI_857]|nr:hypothetical protein B0O99DRAFT_641527 [Bisporella sp. PMI_857]